MSPITVLVTGAAGQIAYSLLGSIARGDVFGLHQEIILHMLDIEFMQDCLNGVVMELEDCSFPLLKKVLATSKVEEAFKDIDVALLVGAMPRKDGMERKDLLRANVRIFKEQGHALDNFAKKTVKVLVVGNPANTNCLIASKYAPTIPVQNFSALTRLDLNRAEAQIAARLGVPCNNVKGCIIWGNHSNTQFADASHASVTLLDGSNVSVPIAVKDDQWLRNDFLTIVQTRGAAVIKARKLSSAMSAAKAICDHMRNWWLGTGADWVSMGVISNGEYNIEKGIIYSFPVITKNGNWEIVLGLSIDDFSREKMDLSANELIEERDSALSVCSE